jgi:hypothetical protein
VSPVKYEQGSYIPKEDILQERSLIFLNGSKFN